MKFKETMEPTNQIRIMLKNGKKTWRELMQQTKCSPTTLSKILKTLIDSAEIQTEKDERQTNNLVQSSGRKSKCSDKTL